MVIFLTFAIMMCRWAKDGFVQGFQKVLALLPLFKALEVLFIGLYLDNCPWSNGQTAQMWINLFILTPTYLIYIVIFYFLCRGFQITDEEKPTRCEIAMVFFALITFASSFILFFTITENKKDVSIVIAVLYLILTVFLIISACAARSKVLEDSGTFNLQILELGSLKGEGFKPYKASMLLWIGIGSTCFIAQ